MCRTLAATAAAALGSVLFASTAPQAPIDIEAIRAAKRITAVRISEPIHVDGVLDEAAWALAEPAADFYQQLPDEFAPAAHRTEVRFLYDADTLYVGIALLDQPRDGLIINDLKRDFAGKQTDSFGLVLDTFQDRRNAYGFLVNPGGAVRDTLASDNGRRNDANWHAAWQARTSVAADSWSAEYAIPFRMLRFPRGPTQTWGLNMVRTMRAANETTTWSPVPRQFSHYNVAYAGTLEGLAGIEPGRNLQVKPFVTARAGLDLPGRPGRSTDADGGVDLKWGITTSLLLDGSYRTDFSQVEADDQQVNLTRFSAFFPEKREFFLENPASFQIGMYESDSQRRDLVPFFTRRIGLSSSGQPIPVVGGVRVTGRAGGQGIGILQMRTEPSGERPGDDFTAVRIGREISGRASLGGFYFGREAAGSDDFNRVAGLDFRLAPSRTLQVEAFALHSETSGRDGGWAGRAGFRLDASRHRARLGLVHVGEDFRHDLGFVRRRGIATLFGNYSFVFRPRDSGGTVREYTVGPEFEVTGNDRYTRFLTGVGTLSFDVSFSDGGQFKAWGTRTTEQLDAPFAVGGSSLTVPRGEYRFGELGASYKSNNSAALSGDVEVTSGGFWTGRQRSVTTGVRVRFNSHVTTSASFGRSVITLPEGSWTADLLGLKVDWYVTPRMVLNVFVQYNGETDTWLSNVRYNLVHRPLSDIYVVWNETRLPGVTRRAVMLKYTHMIAF